MRERRRSTNRSVTVSLLAIVTAVLVVSLTGPAAAGQLPILVWRNSPGEQAMVAGLQAGLKTLGMDTMVTPSVLSAEGDATKAQNLAKQAVAQSPVAVVAVGGVMAQAVLAASESVPTVIVGVIDPISLKLIKDWSGSGNNAVVASSFVAERQRAEYTLTLLPDARRWAVLGSTAAESKRQADELVALGDDLGLLDVSVGLADTAEGLVEQAKRLLPDADLFFLVDDGLAEQAAPQLVQVAGGKPVIGSTEAELEAGALAGLTVDAQLLGDQASRLLAQVIAGQATAGLPSEAPERVKFEINLRSARALGLNIPIDLLAAADQVIE
ncbi:MAG: ABC transporter substrate-binding protein [Chitinophagales bacterium]